MKSMVHWYWVTSLLLFGGMVYAQGAPSRSGQVEVAVELEHLMSEHGFKVRGIEQTQGALGHIAGDELRARLDTLLEAFDHIIVQAPGGGVERVIILGEKSAYVPPPMVTSVDGASETDDGGASKGDEIVLGTTRKGSSHAVTLTLEGVGGQKAEESLLIDTGADQVVLPVSLMSTLGMSPSSTRSQSVQTANGSVEAYVGKLSAIWLGETRISDVEVAFIDDQRLGGNSLLGMSVLGRFRMTIDDEKNQLTLASK
ncbi:retropepsin-like aspartic protease family protein [Thiorhodococcus fuscus]|uniref:TIGR02281 family clan AA aspartic protease n=1 Tax=Thiorhodococcus fuscus TaxID=527200 RepID=A0ABW4Y7D7_9GAMM